MPMKKYIILLLICALCLCACETKVDIPSDGKEVMLIMDGILNSGSVHHQIILIESNAKSGIIKAKPCRLDIYINDELACSADEFRQKGRKCIYDFDAVFSPGDKVKISTYYEGEEVWTESLVPEAPVLSDIIPGNEISATYKEWGNSSTRDFWEIYVEISDPEGYGNAYMISEVRTTAECECIRDKEENPDFNRKGEIENHEESKNIYTFMEPSFQMPGIPDDYKDPQYSLFDDRLFDGKKYRFLLLSDTDPEYKPSYGYVSFGETWEYRNTITVKISAVSPETFRYFSAVEYDGAGDLIPIAHAPTHYPCNINGGLGYVAVCSSATLSKPLPPAVWKGDGAD